MLPEFHERVSALALNEGISMIALIERAVEAYAAPRRRADCVPCSECLAIILGAISIALAARYGYKGADTLVDGVISAVVFGAIALCAFLFDAQRCACGSWPSPWRRRDRPHCRRRPFRDVHQ